MIFCSESSTMSSDMVCWWRSQLVLGWYCEFRNKKRETEKEKKSGEMSRVDKGDQQIKHLFFYRKEKYRPYAGS